MALEKELGRYRSVVRNRWHQTLSKPLVSSESSQSDSEEVEDDVDSGKQHKWTDEEVGL